MSDLYGRCPITAIEFAAPNGGYSCGRPTAARAAWDETAAAWEGLGQPYSTAIALLRAAEAALADGDREAAGERPRRAAGRPAGRQAAGRRDRLARPARADPAHGRDCRTGPRPARADGSRVRGAPPGRRRPEQP